MPTSARSRARSTRGAVMDSPWTRISPFWIGSRRLTQRISVLFPEPDGPHTTMTSPASTSRLTSARTWSGPNHLSTLLNWMAWATARLSLLDHDEDVAEIDGLAGLDADLNDRPRRHRAKLVLHLHGLEDEEPVARRDDLPDLHLDEHDLARHGGLEHLAARTRLAAARADDVAGFFLHPDGIALAVQLDERDAVLLAHVDDVGGAFDQDRPYALGDLARVDVGRSI